MQGTCAVVASLFHRVHDWVKFQQKPISRYYFTNARVRAAAASDGNARLPAEGRPAPAPPPPRRQMTQRVMDPAAAAEFLEQQWEGSCLPTLLAYVSSRCCLRGCCCLRLPST